MCEINCMRPNKYLPVGRFFYWNRRKNMKQKIVLIDFDSTFVIVESLDQLAEIVLAERPDKQAVLEEIVAITKEGMEGKVKMIQKMKFDAPLYMVGDGFTDYEIKKEGLVEKFFAFTENITRQIVVENADVVANTFEEVLKNL